MDFVIPILLGLLIGAIIVYFYLNNKIQVLRGENIHLKVSLDEKVKSYENQMSLIMIAKEQMNKDFKAVASEIIEKDRVNLQVKNTETITPLKEEIKNFKESLNTISKEQSDDRSALKQQIETLANLSENTIKGAEKLANALTYDNKQQGDWGELVLENILQSSGLKKGKEYDTQKVFRDESGSIYKPDVIVHLPDNKDIVIDSKVSLKAYQNYIDTDDEADLKVHIKSVEAHIKEISLKGYQNLYNINTLDYVFVFFPIEASLLLVLEKQPDLFSNAIKKNVALVSPSTLIMSLKIVHHIWQSEKQNKNTEEIMRLTANMYDKLVGFVESLDYLEAQLKNATKSYEIAKNRLSDGKGNVFSIAEKLKNLGVNPKKQLKQ